MKVVNVGECYEQKKNFKFYFLFLFFMKQFKQDINELNELYVFVIELDYF